jgi:hypothetical protein
MPEYDLRLVRPARGSQSGSDQSLFATDRGGGMGSTHDRPGSPYAAVLTRTHRRRAVLARYSPQHSSYPCRGHTRPVRGGWDRPPLTPGDPRRGAPGVQRGPAPNDCCAEDRPDRALRRSRSGAPRRRLTGVSTPLRGSVSRGSIGIPSTANVGSAARVVRGPARRRESSERNHGSARAAAAAGRSWLLACATLMTAVGGNTRKTGDPDIV